MSDSLTAIYTAANVAQAQLLVGELERAGIRAVVTNTTLKAAAGELPLGVATDPQVCVAEHDAESAREIALAFESALRQGRVAVESSSDDPPAADDDEGAVGFGRRQWPDCPDCNASRQALCQTCGTAGDDFEVVQWGGPSIHEDSPLGTKCAPGRCEDHEGDSRPDSRHGSDSSAPNTPAIDTLEEASTISPNLLKCPTCEEIFEPVYYRDCAWCGYHFSDGVTRPPEDDRVAMTGRAWAVIFVLAAFGLAALGYFLFLLER